MSYGTYNILEKFFCFGLGILWKESIFAIPLLSPYYKEVLVEAGCAKTPAGRRLNPSELGGSAVFLASHASDAMSGHILYVDGGILAYTGQQSK